MEQWQVSGVRRRFGSVNPNGEAHAVGIDGDEACLVFYDPKRHAECWRDAQRIAKVPAMERELSHLRAQLAALQTPAMMREAICWGLVAINDDLTLKDAITCWNEGLGYGSADLRADTYADADRIIEALALGRERLAGKEGE